MNIESNFVEFQNAKRIWAIGSVHSNYESFNSIKDYLLSSFVEGDKLIILGNVIGLGDKAKETISSVLDISCQW